MKRHDVQSRALDCPPDLVIVKEIEQSLRAFFNLEFEFFSVDRHHLHDAHLPAINKRHALEVFIVYQRWCQDEPTVRTRGSLLRCGQSMGDTQPSLLNMRESR